MIEQYLPAQFMNYKLVPNPATGKNDKLPCVSTGIKADAHTPQNWSDHETAVAAVNAGLADGVAFVLTANDPFFFLDLDNCLNDDGSWSNAAQGIYTAFPGAFGEISQSGRGLHIIGKCRPDQFADRRNKWEGWLEFYTKERFIAFGPTGWQPIGGELRIDHDWTDQLRKIIPAREILGELPQGVDPNYTGPADDDVLIGKMLMSTGGAAAAFGGKATVKQLWQADPILARIYPDYGGDTSKFDHSAADAALMAHLAFWTGKDMPRMERLFRRSSLMRPKFERDDYRIKTVQDAARMCNRVYDRPERTTLPPAGTVSSTPPANIGNVDHEVYLNVLEMEQHFAGCVYVRDVHRVLTPSGDLLKPEQFKSYYGGHIFQMMPDGTGPEKNAFIAFTENRAVRFPKVAHCVFDPNRPTGEILNDTVNTYHKPEVTVIPGDVRPFLDLLQRLMPVERDREIFLAWAASCVQNQGKKFQWAPVLQGTEGNGKTFVMNCIAHTIGEALVHRPNPKELGEKFNGWIERSIFILVEEVHMDGRRDTLDDLKPKITNEYLPIRGMQQEERMARNYAKWGFCTNHSDAVIKSTNDRRYCIFFTAQQSYDDIVRDGMDGMYFPNLYKWAREGGYAHVADYLMTYDIPADLDPAGACHRAPRTSSTDKAIERTTGAIESVVIEACQDGTIGFKGGMISSWALDKLLESRRLRLSMNKRSMMLEELGYIKVGRARNALSMEGGIRPMLYAHKSMTIEGDPTDAYFKAQEYFGRSMV